MIDKAKRVYIAACIGPSGMPMGSYKVGCSNGHELRLKTVTTNLPFSLELVATVPGGRFMEAAFHLYLREYRIKGEYFTACAETDQVAIHCRDFGEPPFDISDEGTEFWGNDDLRRIRLAFLKYHSISIQEACSLAGVDVPADRNSALSNRVMAAAALEAQARYQYVTYPRDVIYGLLGERHPRIARHLSAPQQEQVA